VGGTWEETPLLVILHTGAKSGVTRVNPVAYMPDGGRYLIWAANGGASTNPGWYHNLRAYPETTIEVGSDTNGVVAGSDRHRA
jgi:deazaflavin-dependent oxidoreductase (nitroreductase family)